MAKKYIRTTNKRLQPEIRIDSNGKKTISDWSFVRGNFRKILRQYQNYIIDCLINIEEHKSFADFYRDGAKDKSVSRCRAVDLYLNHLPPKK